MRYSKYIIGICVALLSVFSAFAIGEDPGTPTPTPASISNSGDIPAATIINDEGGTRSITGSVAYTNAFFTAGVGEPLIILEDQTGFVTRNRGYDMPIASQVLGQITSDFYTSPFTYSMTLPIEPKAPYNDVDHDGQTDKGVIVYAIAYWDNIWGDSYLEERDLYGGGWSGAYVSTRVSPNSKDRGEYQGGRLLIYAPDNLQAFPSGFGTDKKLFTDDDPLVMLPQGYTVVNMDADPFTFDRSAYPDIELYEGEGATADDFSGMSYTDAFDAMLEKFRNEYAFTEYKGIDWDAKRAEFRPRFEEADRNNDAEAYGVALNDFAESIDDGHVSAYNDYAGAVARDRIAGGLGFAVRELSDGRILVNYVTQGGAAEQAGIQYGTQIISIDRTPIDAYLSGRKGFIGSFSTPQEKRLAQLIFGLRFPIGTRVNVGYQNPNGTQMSTTITTEQEYDSLSFAYDLTYSGSNGLGTVNPVEYKILDSGYMLISIGDFEDDANLTIRLWERALVKAKQDDVPGIILDMRTNGGGSGWLADQMAAYFFDEGYVTGNNSSYDPDTGTFYTDPNIEDKFILPTSDKRYSGDVVVLVGPSCYSACEFFSYDMTIANRATVIGQYATGGLGGGVEDFYMPEGISVRMTVARAVDADGNIHIEGKGVAPTVVVPVTEDNMAGGDDVVLQAAIDYLDGK